MTDSAAERIVVSMDVTPNLGLPFLAALQGHRHITHNEALKALDALVQVGVVAQLAVPPDGPEEGARYLVALDAEDDWAGEDGKVAAYQDGAWMFYAPRTGWLVWLADEARLLVFDGSEWIGAANAAPFELLGVNTTPDSTNRLAVSAPATLLNHEGDSHRLVINKASGSDTASMIYQSGFSGRAETGLAGNQNFSIKVSPDGASWFEALTVDSVTGEVSIPRLAPELVPISSTTFDNLPAQPTGIEGETGLLISDERNGPTYCTSDGTWWRRALDGRIAQSAVVNFYLDSVSGSDTNTGTSSASAIKTMSKLSALIAALPEHRRAGLRVALKRGSLWRERFSADATMAGLRIETYGSLSDAMPLFDCADALVNASFAKTTGRSNVYEIAHTVEIDTYAAEWPGLWVDGTRLTFAASLAACDATPGTFYVASPANNASLTLNVHAPGSTDPTSDGKLYEATTRKSGVDLYFCPYAEIENVHGRRNHSSHGSITLGRWNRARGCRTSDGNTHNMLFRAFCEIEDHIADGWYGNGNSATAYVGYDTDGDAGDGHPGGDVWMRLKNCAARQTEQVRIAPAAITAITKANPCVVTAPAHGLSQWDFITISGVAGMTELNGRTFIVSAVTTDTLTLQTANLDDAGRVNVNSSSYGTYSSGGVIRLSDFMDHPTSASSTGFYFHTDGQLIFDRVELEGCEVYGCSMPFNAAHTRLFTLDNVSARQFFIGVGSMADKTVFRGLQGNVSFLNRPPMIGATLLRTELANQTIEMDGISATLNATGNMYLTQAGVTLRFRRGTLTGFNSLVRCVAANQTLDIAEMRHLPNGKTGSGYNEYDINATAAAGIRISSDFNDYGGGGRSFVFNGTTYTLDQWRALNGEDWLSKA